MENKIEMALNILDRLSKHIIPMIKKIDFRAHFINHGLLFALTLKNHSNTFKLHFNKQHIFKKLSIIIVVFFYLTSWFMPHCCRTEIGDGYKSIYNRIFFRLFDESIKYRKNHSAANE